MRTIVLPLLALAAAAPALAQSDTGPGTADVSKVAAGTYAVDANHTQVLFTVKHMGFSLYTGEFTQPTGSLTIDPKTPTRATVDVSFPIDKAVTTAAHLNEHLTKPDFFDAAQFPTARFVSTKVTVTGTKAMIAGTLTMHGVSKPIVLSARFIGSGANPMSKKATIGFQATTTVKRSDFGMGQMTAMISDEVPLTINAAFEAQ